MTNRHKYSKLFLGFQTTSLSFENLLVAILVYFVLQYVRKGFS